MFLDTKRDKYVVCMTNIALVPCKKIIKQQTVVHPSRPVFVFIGRRQECIKHERKILHAKYCVLTRRVT